MRYLFAPVDNEYLTNLQVPNVKSYLDGLMAKAREEEKRRRRDE